MEHFLSFSPTPCLPSTPSTFFDLRGFRKLPVLPQIKTESCLGSNKFFLALAVTAEISSHFFIYVIPKTFHHSYGMKLGIPNLHLSLLANFKSEFRRLGHEVMIMFPKYTRA